MDTQLLLELAGLQSVQKLIQDRIDQLSQNSGPQSQRRVSRAPLTTAAPFKKPPSKAKLDALAHARAVKAQNLLDAAKKTRKRR